MPVPSADHVVPFHFAMVFAGTPPAVVKFPPAYRFVPITASAVTVLFVLERMRIVAQKKRALMSTLGPGFTAAFLMLEGR